MLVRIAARVSDLAYGSDQSELLLLQTPMKLDAVKALRKEPVVETRTPFVRESRQAYPL